MTGITIEKDGITYNYVLFKLDPNSLTNSVKNNFIDHTQFIYVSHFNILVDGQIINQYMGLFSFTKTDILMTELGINARLIYIKLAQELGYDESIVPEIVD